MRSTSRSMSDISSVVLIRTCCGWVCDHSRAPLRSLRLLVALSVLILPSVFSYAEDLTTLDGKIFTNITEITKYPKLVVFTYNSNRTSVAISNLPAEFRAKYGIIIKTNTPNVSVTQNQRSPFANPVDLFLWQNRESDLEQHESDYFTTNEPPFGFTRDKQRWIYLRHAGIELIAFTTTHFHRPDLKDLEDSQEMHFDIGQEESVTNVFNKFFEWDTVASKNHTENFETEIARCPMSRATSSIVTELYGGVCVYNFSWQDGKSQLRVTDSAPYSGSFEKDDLIHFQTLLTNLPSMKEKLSSAIRNKETQKDLFK